MGKTIWVIIPVYNAEKTIEEAVSSVLRLQHEDIFVLLVNDGSQDSSGKICDKLAQRYSNLIAIHQENCGVSVARNVGIEYVLKHCSDGYIAFLDADDMWASGITLHEIEKEDADLIAYSSAMCNEAGTLYRIDHRFENRKLELRGANIQWLNDGTFAAFFYRIDLIRDNQIRFMKDIKGNEDVIFWRQATFCARRLIFREDILYIYRMNPSSVTHTTVINEENALHIPDAWNQAKYWIHILKYYTNEEKQRWIRLCEESSGARLLESARLLAQEGYTKEEIRRIVCGSHLYAYLEKLEIEKLAVWQQKDLQLLRKSFDGFVRYHQIRGVALKCGKVLLRIPLIRKIREQRRFNLTSV